jgi:lipopolysaccharide transport system permease protein
MPLSIVFSNLVRFGVQLILFIIIMIYYWITGFHFQITPYIMLFPVLVILMAGLGLGLGMIISALTTKYRDLAFLIQFGVPLLMYTTTVVYPLSSAPAKYKWLVILNPMTGIIETFRTGFLGNGSFSWLMLGYSFVFMVVVMLLGTIIFNKVEKSFVDTV